MFKNTVISLVALIAFSTVSISAFAADSEQNNNTLNVISAANAANNDAKLLQVAEVARVNKNGATSQSVISQPQLQATEKSDSGLSSWWLFAVALFWFVILSNRRSI